MGWFRSIFFRRWCGHVAVSREKIFLLLLLIFLQASAHCQHIKKVHYKPTKSSCFDVMPLRFTIVNGDSLMGMMPYVAIRDSNFICYTDTLDNSDTVWFACIQGRGNSWMVFATPFSNPPTPGFYRFTDMDRDGQPELFVESYISYTTWPRGHSINNASVVFRIGSSPAIIFNCTNSCDVINLGGLYNDHPMDLAVGREINIDSNGISVGKLNISGLDKEEKDSYRKFCRLSVIESGRYRLVGGQFMKEPGFIGK